MIKENIKKYLHFYTRVVNLALIVAACFAYHQVAQARVEEQEKAMIKTSQGTSYKNGTYKGSGKGFGGDIVVSVTVKNKVIDKIEILEAKNEDTAYLENAKSLLETMKKTQSANVDVVSGATYSSKGIIEATKNALKEAS